MLTVKHGRADDHDIVVLEGLAHEEAVGHLCRTLCNGSAFGDASGLVIDLKRVPQLSAPTVSALRDAAQTWDHGRRWFAVTGLSRYAGIDQHLRDHSYADVNAATAAAHRFYQLVSGKQTWWQRPLLIVQAARGCGAVVQEVAGLLTRSTVALSRLAAGQIVR